MGAVKRGRVLLSVCMLAQLAFSISPHETSTVSAALGRKFDGQQRQYEPDTPEHEAMIRKILATMEEASRTSTDGVVVAEEVDAAALGSGPKDETGPANTASAPSATHAPVPHDSAAASETQLEMQKLEREAAGVVASLLSTQDPADFDRASALTHRISAALQQLDTHIADLTSNTGARVYRPNVINDEPVLLEMGAGLESSQPFAGPLGYPQFNSAPYASNPTLNPTLYTDSFQNSYSNPGSNVGGSTAMDAMSMGMDQGAWESARFARQAAFTQQQQQATMQQQQMMQQQAQQNQQVQQPPVWWPRGQTRGIPPFFYPAAGMPPGYPHVPIPHSFASPFHDNTDFGLVSDPRMDPFNMPVLQAPPQAANMRDIDEESKDAFARGIQLGSLLARGRHDNTATELSDMTAAQNDQVQRSQQIKAAVHRAIAEAIPAAVAATVSAVRHAQAESMRRRAMAAAIPSRSKQEATFMHAAAAGADVLPPLNVPVTGPPGYGPVPSLPMPMAALPHDIRTIAAALPIPYPDPVDEVDEEEEDEPIVKPKSSASKDKRHGESPSDLEEDTGAPPAHRFAAANSRVLPIGDGGSARRGQHHAAYEQRVDTAKLPGRRLAPSTNLADRHGGPPLRSYERIVVSTPFDPSIRQRSEEGSDVSGNLAVPPVNQASDAEYLVPYEHVITTTTEQRTVADAPEHPQMPAKNPGSDIFLEGEDAEKSGTKLRGAVKILQAGSDSGLEGTEPSFFTPVWKTAGKPFRNKSPWTQAKDATAASMANLMQSVSGAFASLRSAVIATFDRTRGPTNETTETPTVNATVAPRLDNEIVATFNTTNNGSNSTVTAVASPVAAAPSASPSSLPVVAALSVQLHNIDEAKKQVETAIQTIQDNEQTVRAVGDRVDAAVKLAVQGHTPATNTGPATTEAGKAESTPAVTESRVTQQNEGPQTPADSDLRTTTEAEPLSLSPEGTELPAVPAAVPDTPTPKPAEPAPAASPRALRFKVAVREEPSLTPTIVATVAPSSPESTIVAAIPSVDVPMPSSAPNSAVLKDASAVTSSTVLKPMPTVIASAEVAPAAVETVAAAQFVAPTSVAPAVLVAAPAVVEPVASSVPEASPSASPTASISLSPSPSSIRVSIDFPNKIIEHTEDANKNVLQPAVQDVKALSGNAVSSGIRIDETSKEIAEQDAALTRAKAAAANLEAGAIKGGAPTVDTKTITGGQALNLPVLELKPMNVTSDVKLLLKNQPDAVALVQSADERDRQILEAATLAGSSADLTHPVAMTSQDELMRSREQRPGRSQTQAVLAPTTDLAGKPAGEVPQAEAFAVGQPVAPVTSTLTSRANIVEPGKSVKPTNAFLELSDDDVTSYSQMAPPHLTDIALSDTHVNLSRGTPGATRSYGCVGGALACVMDEDVVLASMSHILSPRFSQDSAELVASASLTAGHMSSAFALAHVAAMAGDTADITGAADMLGSTVADLGHESLLRTADKALMLDTLISSTDAYQTQALKLALGDGKAVSAMYDAVWAIAALGRDAIQHSLLAGGLPLRDIVNGKTDDVTLRFAAVNGAAGAGGTVSALSLLSRGGIGVDAWTSLREFAHSHPAAASSRNLARFRDRQLALGEENFPSFGSEGKYAPSPLPSDKPKVMPDTLPRPSEAPLSLHLGQPTEEFLNMADRSWWPGVSPNGDDGPVGESRIGPEAVTAGFPFGQRLSDSASKKSQPAAVVSAQGDLPLSFSEHAGPRRLRSGRQSVLSSTDDAAAGQAIANSFLDTSDSFFPVKKKAGTSSSQGTPQVGLGGRPLPPPDAPPLDLGNRGIVLHHADFAELAEHSDPDIRHSVAQLFSDPAARLAAFAPPVERTVPAPAEQASSPDNGVATAEGNSAILPPRPVVPFAVPAKVGMHSAEEIALEEEVDEPPADAPEEAKNAHRPDRSKSSKSAPPETDSLNDPDVLPHVTHGDPFGQ